VTVHLGIRVRHERERQGLSREELTQRMPEDMRMHTNTLWNIEVGRTKNPRMDQLQALAQALGVSVPYLMGEKDAPGPGGRRRQRSLQKEHTDD
jgi:transcriptional regulator with XRE-family HTH domain